MISLNFYKLDKTAEGSIQLEKNTQSFILLMNMEYLMEEKKKFLHYQK